MSNPNRYDPAVYTITLIPTTLTGQFTGRLEYVAIKATSNDDVHHTFNVIDRTLHTRLLAVLNDWAAAAILAALRRGETVILPGHYSPQHILDLKFSPELLQTA